MLDSAIEVPEQSIQLESSQEKLNIPEISHEEWIILCKKDPKELTPQEAILRDKPLLIAAQKGDTEAWTQIWQYYENAIVKKIREFFWDTDDIFDVAQAIYIRAYEKLITYDVNQKFFPWIHTVIRNFSMNTIKHINVVKMINCGSLNEHDMYERKNDLGFEPQLIDNNISALEECVKKEEVENLWKCIEKLKPNHKTIITLKHFKELSYIEISNQLDIPIGTVMSRLFNARAELASIWNDIIEDIPLVN